MSLGIGVLCSTREAGAPWPNAIVLIGGGQSGETPYSAKLLAREQKQLFSVCVGQHESCDALLDEIETEIQHLTALNHRALWRAISGCVQKHRFNGFQLDVLPNFAFPSADIPISQQPRVLQAWEHYDIGFHAIIGTFDEHRRALMYLIARTENSAGWVHRIGSAGIATIGHGAHGATLWLNYRSHVIHSDVVRSAYHAYEAQHVVMQDHDGTSRPEILISVWGKTFRLTAESPTASGSPVSLDQLEALLKELGPRNTQIVNFESAKQAAAE